MSKKLDNIGAVTRYQKAENTEIYRKKTKVVFYKTILISP